MLSSLEVRNIKRQLPNILRVPKSKSQALWEESIQGLARYTA